MDDDLRSLERRAAADPTLEPLLRKARERAGLGRSLALRSVEAEEREAALEAAAAARARFREGRASHARTLDHALRAWVAGAFTDFPGLEELTIDWRLHERRDGPWTVGLRVEVPVRDRARPPQRRNRLAPEDARLLEGELVALAHLFPRRHDLFGGRRLSRDRERDLVVVQHGPRDGDREGTALRVPLRRLEELREGLAELSPLEAGYALPIASDGRTGAPPLVRTRAGAARLLAGAEADLADDDAELLADGGQAWDAFLTTLFADFPELQVFAVRGWTSGYNDNWYDEHDQELCVSPESLADLADDWRAPLPLEVTQAIERAPSPAEPGALLALRAGLPRDLDESLFGDLLRLRHGHDWLLVVRRDGEHVVERLLLRPEAPPL